MGAEPVAAAICSRAGCRAEAAWRIQWRNPRIHAADRTKTWVACDEHRAYLRGFLEARSFPVTVTPLAPPPPDSPDSSSPELSSTAKSRVHNDDTPVTDAGARRVASSARLFATGEGTEPRRLEGEGA